ncbi:MAG: SGNH/GDSL hydrolase family protein [Parvibaculaceae bacterium]
MTRKYLDMALGILVLLIGLYFIVEGAVSVWHWKSHDTSLLYKAYHHLTAKKLEFPGVITDERQITQFVPEMQKAGVAMGNVPFPELKTYKASIFVDDAGCQVLRPNLQKTGLFLRTGLYEPLDPPSVFYDRDAVLSQDLQQFLRLYGLDFHNMSTNESGERLTVPTKERDRKVLIVGDSIAFGAMIDDSLTLASSLQNRDDLRQYLTISAPGLGSDAILCNLDRSGKRYRGRIEELIYFYSEDDLSEDPGVVAHLKSFVAEHGIKKVTVIYTPYLYNVAPQFTRYRGYRSERIPTWFQEKAKLKSATDAAGFRWLDLGEIVVADSANFGTQFGILASYVDHGHLSAHGMANLVKAYLSLEDVTSKP